MLFWPPLWDCKIPKLIAGDFGGGRHPPLKGSHLWGVGASWTLILGCCVLSDLFESGGKKLQLLGLKRPISGAMIAGPF
jgi:hypothetical protein